MIFKIGEKIELKTFPPITQKQLKDYAEASGDPNPIHLDEKAAKSVGLPGVIAHGMLVAAFIAERAKQYLNSKISHTDAHTHTHRHTVMKKLQIRFKAMTLLGDQIEIDGSVKEILDHEVVLELHARNQRGETVALGNVRWNY